MNKRDKKNKKYMNRYTEEKKNNNEDPVKDNAGNVEISDVDVDPEVADIEEEVNMEAKANDELEAKVEKLEAQLAEQKKEYMFLMAEFDNFRKRTVKEKAEIIKNGAENAFKNLLPIIDDFERAIQVMKDSNDANAIKEGVELIYHKFLKYLEQNGVKVIDINDNNFNTEYHEAVTTFPTPDESLKGKIIETIQKGYMLNDKVLRHAKVVVGQ